MLKNPLIKVDRVSNVAEVRQLREYGVQLIGTEIKQYSGFDDNRGLSIKEIEKIRREVADEGFFVEIPILKWKTNKIIDFIIEFDLNFIQVIKYDYYKIDARLAEWLAEYEVTVIFSQIQADYDEDPSWVLASLKEKKFPFKVYYQLEIVTGMFNSWEFLKKECPKYPEELQIHDINELARNDKIFISIDYTPENVEEIINAFRPTHGFAFVLGKLIDKRASVHVIQYGDMLSILDKINNIK